MRKTLLLLAFTSLFWQFLPHSNAPKADFWGFFGHKRINRLAVFTLPPEMMPLFKTEIEYLTEHAIDPDRRRFAVATEGYRHYINLDKWAFLPPDKIDAQILHTDVFIVGEKNDTALLFDYQTIRRQKRDYFLKGKTIKKLFGRDSIVVADTSMRRFFVYNVARIQPDEPLSIARDSLVALFKKERLVLKGVKSVFATDKLTPAGILPYHLQSMHRQLTDAFVQKDRARILKISAELGHYIADAHVPLHTTSNYDGQQTNQNGVHAFWESRLPEFFADNQYDFFVGRAAYVENPRTFYWNIIAESARLVPAVLRAEKDVQATFEADKKYCLETVNGVVLKKPCFDFARAYHDRLGGMVEEQMRRAILALGSAWYSAWVDAGQPDLTNLPKQPPLSKEEQKTLEEADKNAKNGGKMLGRDEGQ